VESEHIAKKKSWKNSKKVELSRDKLHDEISPLPGGHGWPALCQTISRETTGRPWETTLNRKSRAASLQKGGSFLCLDQYCTRCMGALGKGEINFSEPRRVNWL
jgi:hypothetical protein